MGDAAALLEALRASGAAVLEPVRFRFLEALARRAEAHTGEARRLIDDKLVRAATALGERCTQACSADSDSIPPFGLSQSKPGMSLECPRVKRPSTGSGRTVGGDSGRTVGGDSGRTVGGDSGRTVGGDSGRTVGGDSGRTVGGDSGRTVGGDSGRTVGGDSGQTEFGGSGQAGLGVADGGINTTDNAPPASPLAELLNHIRDHALPEAPSHPLHAPADAAPRGELKSVAYFQRTWSQMSVDQQLAQALAQVPDNAGPFNPQRLAVQALQRMRDTAPDYLRHMLIYLDGLIWLEQAEAAGKAAPKSAGRGEREKRRKPARGAAGAP